MPRTCISPHSSTTPSSIFSENCRPPRDVFPSSPSAPKRLSLAGASAWCVPLQVLVRISDPELSDVCAAAGVAGNVPAAAGRRAGHRCRLDRRDRYRGRHPVPPCAGAGRRRDNSGRLSALTRTQGLYAGRGGTRARSQPADGRLLPEGRSPDHACGRARHPSAGYGVSLITGLSGGV
jgi:hypothetical protein